MIVFLREVVKSYTSQWVAGEKGGGRTPATHYTLYDRELAYGDRSVCSIAVFHGNMTNEVWIVKEEE